MLHMRQMLNISSPILIGPIRSNSVGGNNSVFGNLFGDNLVVDIIYDISGPRLTHCIGMVSIYFYSFIGVDSMYISNHCLVVS